MGTVTKLPDRKLTKTHRKNRRTVISLICVFLTVFAAPTVKEPKTLVVEGIDANVGHALPFDPTHVWFVDPASKSEVWFCLYPGEIVNRRLRLAIND